MGYLSGAESIRCACSGSFCRHAAFGGQEITTGWLDSWAEMPEALQKYVSIPHKRFLSNICVSLYCTEKSADFPVFLLSVGTLWISPSFVS